MSIFRVAIDYSYRVTDTMALDIEADSFDDIDVDDVRRAMRKAGYMPDDDDTEIDDWSVDV